MGHWKKYKGLGAFGFWPLRQFSLSLQRRTAIQSVYEHHSQRRGTEEVAGRTQQRCWYRWNHYADICCNHAQRKSRSRQDGRNGNDYPQWWRCLRGQCCDGCQQYLFADSISVRPVSFHDLARCWNPHRRRIRPLRWIRFFYWLHSTAFFFPVPDTGSPWRTAFSLWFEQHVPAVRWNYRWQRCHHCLAEKSGTKHCRHNLLLYCPWSNLSGRWTERNRQGTARRSERRFYHLALFRCIGFDDRRRISIQPARGSGQLEWYHRYRIGNRHPLCWPNRNHSWLPHRRSGRCWFLFVGMLCRKRWQASWRLFRCQRAERQRSSVRRF